MSQTEANANGTLGALEGIEARRRIATRALDTNRQRHLGQFLTPLYIGRFMASLVDATGERIRILEPGAGIGSLIAPLVAELCSRSPRPRRIEITAVEIDPILGELLDETLVECRAHCLEHGVEFRANVIASDFIEFAVSRLQDQLSFDSSQRLHFDVVIQNPPYRKIGSTSRDRRLVQRVGLETPNLYAAFLGLAAKLLESEGQLVAITPRSFCNGTYFRAFRREFLSMMAFTRIHLIESRNAAFADDGILQENIIFRAVRAPKRNAVVVTSGDGSPDSHRFGRRLPYRQLVRAEDPDLFIHLVPEPGGEQVAERIRGLPCTLGDLGLTVSTGRVVDFRAREHLRQNPSGDTVPLVYPAHFDSGFVQWPVEGKKPNAIVRCQATAKLLVPEGVYVLVKRFSAKEEVRRITAVVFDPERTAAPSGVGFENHLNYFHENEKGVVRDVAIGLAAFLNSTAVDSFFRQFSGHTQVNAGDLRKLRYPSLDTLHLIASLVRDGFPTQDDLDDVINRTLGHVESAV